VGLRRLGRMDRRFSLGTLRGFAKGKAPDGCLLAGVAVLDAPTADSGFCSQRIG